MTGILYKTVSVSLVSLMIGGGAIIVVPPLNDDLPSGCVDDIFDVTHQVLPPITPMSSNPGEKAVFDGRVFFPAFRPTTGTELFWYEVCGDYFDYRGIFNAYDETIPGGVGFVEGEFTEFCDRLFFLADRQIGGLIRTRCWYWIDGGEDVIAEYFPVDQNGVEFYNIDEVTSHKGGAEIWFTAEGNSPIYGETSRYLFRMFVPVVGPCTTEMVLIVDPSLGLIPHVHEVESVGNSVAYTVTFNTFPQVPNNRQLWYTDSFDVSAPVPAAGLPPDPSQLTYDPIAGSLYLTGDATPLGMFPNRVVWRLNGKLPNNQTTNMLASPTTDPGFLEPRNPQFLTPMTAKGGLTFVGDGLNSGREIWRVFEDVGSMTLFDVRAASGSSNPFDLVAKDDKVFFLTNGIGPGFEDGLFSIATQGPTITNLATVDSPSELTLVDPNRFYFAGTIPGCGIEVWNSDGTSTGTVPVADINIGPDGSNPRDFVRYFNSVVFTATFESGKTPAESNRELITIDYN